MKSFGNSYTKYTWTGNDHLNNLNWSNPLNWCGSYVDGACQGASSAPVGTDSVVFNGVCGVHCAVTIDAPVTVNTITILADFPGTISQGAFNVTVNGTNGSGYTQLGGTWQGGAGTFTVGPATSQKFNFNGGTFIGGAGNITIGNSGATDIAYFTGGNFTASSGTTLIKGVADFRGLTSFTHNGGSFEFSTGTSSTVGGHWFTGTSAVFKHVRFYAGTTSNISMNLTTLVMDGDLVLSGASLSTVTYNDGTVDLRVGNVIRTHAAFTGTMVTKFTGTSAQTIDMTAATSALYPGIWVAQTAVTGSFEVVGTAITLAAGFIVTGNMGTIDHNGVAFTFNSNNPAAGIYDTQGYVEFPSVTIGNNTIRFNVGLVKVVNLIISGSGSANTSNGTGVFEVSGNITFDSPTSTYQSNATIKMVGGNNQVVDCTGATVCGLPAFTIEKSANTLSFIGVPAIFGNFEYVSGNVTIPSTIQFGWGTGGISSSITSNGLIFNNVVWGRLYTSANSFVVNDPPLKITGNLTFSNTNASTTRLYGMVEVGGNITCDASASGMTWVSAAPAGIIKLNGTNHTLDFSANTGLCIIPELLVAASGNVTSVGNFRTYHYTRTSGTVDFTASTMTINSSSGTISPGTTEFGNVIMDGASYTLVGTMIVRGYLSLSTSTTGPRSTTGGNYDVYGNLIYSSVGYNGTSTIRLLGSADTTISRSSTYVPTGTIKIEKDVGKKVSMASSWSLGSGQNLHMVSGSLEIGGSPAQTLAISGGGTLTMDTGTTIKKSGGTFTISGASVPNAPYGSGTVVP